jgi:S1-C subfamily serine protease
MDKRELHEKILYPVVRVRTEKAGGSGTVIYSKPNPDDPEEYQSFVLTCEHVVSDAIKQKKEWDSLLKQDVKKDILEQVGVEIFDYVFMSKVNGATAMKADIIAYDKSEDIAILKLESPKPVAYVSQLLPRDKIKDIKLFTDCYASGCSMGHEPFANRGQITFLDEKIENKSFLMTNASSIFGNSGGAIFLDTGEQIGITARITAMQLGFGIDIITWMGFAIHPTRIYDFIDNQELKFLYDPSDTYAAAMDRRKKKEKEALRQLFGDEGK